VALALALAFVTGAPARPLGRRGARAAATHLHGVRAASRHQRVRAHREHHSRKPGRRGSSSGAGRGSSTGSSNDAGGSTGAGRESGGSEQEEAAAEEEAAADASAAAKPKAGNLPEETGETLLDPIDSRFLTDVPFGARSYWLQPWRAYLDTWPASRLTEALGINFPENPAYAQATAQMLQEGGFKLARMQISWSALSYEDPTQFRASHLRSIDERLQAMHEHGLRPLIVLDAGSDDPTPVKIVKLETVAAAPAGAQTVTLSPASAAEVVPGKTGFNGLTFHGSPDVLITSVGAGDIASLSRPLESALPAGEHGATTLRFAPFQAPTLPDGAPNPEFQATLAGWLDYVAAVSRTAASVVGPGGYDLEVWNELTFGSQFLNAYNYYAETPNAGEGSGEEEGTPEGEAEGEAGEAAHSADAPSEAGQGTGEAQASTQAEAAEEDALEAPAQALTPNAAASSEHANLAARLAPALTQSPKKAAAKAIRKALLNATVAFVRDPANGFSPAVGITDGFASETPFPSGADAPIGLTALSKHPYTGAKTFPAEAPGGALRPINALGGRDTATAGSFVPLFIPAYQSLFPEYWLTATSTETTIRDVAPFTTYVYGFPHGREVGPAGGAPVQKWITEFNVSPARGTVVGPDEVTPQTQPSAALTAADHAHFEAKTVLRSLVANVSKGVSREYFYHAGPGPMDLLGEGFFKALEANPGVYPGAQTGGETIDGLRNMLARFAGPGPEGKARQLTLSAIAQEGQHAQFAGDGSAAHPALYDRDVLAVFPFQSSPTRFVIPVYVMTRDLLTLYEPSASASDVHRFDLPAENFRITLGNLPEAAQAPAVSAYDPLLDQQTPARLLSRAGTSATFEIAATDYPRMLTIEY
jgi:hypothetical protein